MAVIVDMLALGVKNAALAVTVNLDALLANLTNGVGLVWVRVDVQDRVGSVGGVRTGDAGGSSGRVGARIGTRERTTRSERTTDGENDAHGHCRGENSGHTEYGPGLAPHWRGTPGQQSPCDDGPDGIIGASRLDDEPEQDVGHVDDPDGLL